MINKNWTCEEAFAANEKFLADNPSVSFADPSLPFSQWEALNKLDTCMTMFEAGHQKSLMLAIRVCASHDLPLPDWAARAYIKAFDRVNHAHEKSWDSVFGKPYPKGTNLNAIRKRHALKFAVWHDIKLILKMEIDTAIDDALFERVGKKYAIGKTLTGEYYYFAVRFLGF